MDPSRPQSSPWGSTAGSLAVETIAMGFLKTKPGSAACSSRPGKKRGNQQRNRPVTSLSQSTGDLRPWSAANTLLSEQGTVSQCGTLGRSSSASKLKKFPKLQALPKSALTFDGLYQLAKKRATQKVNDIRSASNSRVSSAMLPTRAAFVPDTPAEQHWASGTLQYIQGAEVEIQDRDVFDLGDRPMSKDSGIELESRLNSAVASRKNSEAQGDPQPQMASTTERPSSQKPKRETREAAADASAAYVSALKQLMSADGDLSNLDSVGGGTTIAKRSKVGEHGFGDEELRRMSVAFNRFKPLESREIHKDVLMYPLCYLGYLKIEEQVCQEIADTVTTYSELDWSEFLLFTERFAAHERAEFSKDFEAIDRDRSGQLDIFELKDLISSLGVTPFKETLNEAMAVVDFDGSGTLDFEEFVHLMAVYRVTEGFTRKEIQHLKGLFERVAVLPPSGGAMELRPDRLYDVMVSMFGPQANGLAKLFANRFAKGDHSNPSLETDLLKSTISLTTEVAPRNDDTVDQGPGLTFPEFVLWARRLREAETEEFRNTFAECDKDGSGRLAADEVTQVISKSGYMPLQIMVSEVMEQADTDHDGTLDFEEFVNLMQIWRKTDGFCAAEVAELTQEFEISKMEDGEVSCMELMDILRNMGHVTNLDVVRRLVKQVDFDNSNTLDLLEFIRLMRMHREAELVETLRVFNVEREDLDLLDSWSVKPALNALGQFPTDEMLDEAMDTLIDTKNGETEQPDELTFDQFVAVVDICRKVLQFERRQCAGYSDQEVRKYKKAFHIYDENDNMEIERNELTKLLDDLGIPMVRKEDQQAMLEKLDIARRKARGCGVPDEHIGNMGDASVTFHVLLFLVRMLHTAADFAEVEKDKSVMLATKFTPKEAEDFREIFAYWVKKSAELDGGLNQPTNATDALSLVASGSATAGTKAAAEIKKSLPCLTKDGMMRVVRSLGLNMSQEDRKDLDFKLDHGPFDKERPGRFGFFEFLMFMRWMLDRNFARINETMAQVAAAAENAF